MRVKILVILASALACAFPAFAYSIRGKIVDEGSGMPLRKAEIIAYGDSAEFLAGLNSDQNGVFVTADIRKPQVLVEVSREGYEKVYMHVSGLPNDQLDLGTIGLKKKSIELQEVEVTAQPVIQKPDRYIVIPSAKDVERSASALSLLNTLQMKMPGLRVNELLQSVTIENRSPIYKINGKEVSFSRILSINNENVLRIEYHDMPDIRYDNRSVINFVLKPRQEGGSFVSGISSAVTTGSLSGNVGGSYYYKKSEWNLDYYINWRNYDERVTNSSEQFIGRESPVFRETEGLPSLFGYTDHNLMSGYTYMHDPNTMFSADFSTTFHTRDLNDDARKIQRFGNIEKDYDSRTDRHEEWKSPSLNLFFRKQMKGGNSIEANAYGSYSSGDYSREYADTYKDALKNYFISSVTGNKSWATGAELLYTKQFSRVTARFGVKDIYNRAENDLVENEDFLKNELESNYLYFNGQLVGRLKSLGYSVGVGGVYLHSSDRKSSLDAVRAKINVTLNYQLSKNFSLNYLFMYDPSMPGLSQQSDILQRVDELSVRQGNMSLNPSVWFRNRIYARWNVKKFYTTFWASHSRTVNPIYDAYSYIGNPDSPYYSMFLCRPENGQRDDHLNFQLDLGVQELFNHFSLWGTVGWDGYTVKQDNKNFEDKRFYASVSGNLYFGNWTVSANYEIKPQYSLSGDTFSRSERFNTVGVQYRYKDWYFALSGVNLFTKRGSLYHYFNLSDVHPTEREIYIKDGANMIVLKVVYRINFGKAFKKAKRSLYGGGVDSGVNINY